MLCPGSRCDRFAGDFVALRHRWTECRAQLHDALFATGSWSVRRLNRRQRNVCKASWICGLLFWNPRSSTKNGPRAIASRAGNIDAGQIGPETLAPEPTQIHEKAHAAD